MASSENALDALQQRLREIMNTFSDHVAAEGACKDIEEYRYATGQINGLALAERELLDLKQRIERA